MLCLILVTSKRKRDHVGAKKHEISMKHLRHLPRIQEIMRKNVVLSLLLALSPSTSARVIMMLASIFRINRRYEEVFVNLQMKDTIFSLQGVFFDLSISLAQTDFAQHFHEGSALS